MAVDRIMDDIVNGSVVGIVDGRVDAIKDSEDEILDGKKDSILDGILDDKDGILNSKDGIVDGRVAHRLDGRVDGIRRPTHPPNLPCWELFYRSSHPVTSCH